MNNSFVARSIKPYLASAIAMPGIVSIVNRQTIITDQVHVFFSLPVIPCSLDSTVVSFSGGIDVLDMSWTSDRSISASVKNMSSMTYYSISTSGIFDYSGNQVT